MVVWEQLPYHRSRGLFDEFLESTCVRRVRKLVGVAVKWLIAFNNRCRYTLCCEYIGVGSHTEAEFLAIASRDIGESSL